MLMKFLLVIILFPVLLIGIVWCTPYRTSIPFYHEIFYTNAEYKKTCAGIISDAEKMNLYQKDSLLRNVVSEKLFQFWEGTRWGYNGTTEIPGEGKIACGYFVTTILRDCGFKINRSELAQMGSENMMMKLLEEKNLKRYHNVDVHQFISEIKKSGDQLYFLGLDTHIGFLLCEKGECYFIHSSGRVVKEIAEKSNAVIKSNYRVTGCITADEKFMDQWGK